MCIMLLFKGIIELNNGIKWKETIRLFSHKISANNTRPCFWFSAHVLKLRREILLTLSGGHCEFYGEPNDSNWISLDFLAFLFSSGYNTLEPTQRVNWPSYELLIHVLQPISTNIIVTYGNARFQSTFFLTSRDLSNISIPRHFQLRHWSIAIYISSVFQLKRATVFDFAHDL